MRHDPQDDDPWLETDVGECPECGGMGWAPWWDDEGKEDKETPS